LIQVTQNGTAIRPTEFGTSLRALRLRAGLSQMELAERAKVSPQAIGALERGARRAPYRDTVALLAEALALAPEERETFERSAQRRRGARSNNPTETSHVVPPLPARVSSFIDRQSDLNDIAGLLRQHRLVTIVGAGGVGKTSLAIEVARVLRPRFQSGAFFVELASLSDSALVPHAVAAAMESRVPNTSDAIAALAELCRHHERLLVLDNCEHLHEAAARVAATILARCPGITILATSRQPLHTSGEATYRLPSLDVPPLAVRLSTQEALRHNAVALFVDRARAADARFVLTDEASPVVAEIVRRLDGIPLAIELAAARVSLIGATTLQKHLDERFQLLTAGDSAALPRHRTLRATIDWSFELLTPPEKAVLRRAAVFAGGWTLEAATAACCGDEVSADKIAALLSNLVDRSLVVAETEREPVRYRLQETTRLYALERLAAATEDRATRQRHAAYLLQIAENAYEARFIAPLDRWLGVLATEIHNMRAALQWAVDESGDVTLAARLAASLGEVWLSHGLLDEGKRWVEAALARTDHTLQPSVRARAWIAEAGLSHGPQRVRAAQQALSLLDDDAPWVDTFGALIYRTWGLIEEGSLAAAERSSGELLRRTEQEGMGRVGAVLARATALAQLHRFDEARTFFSEALASARASSDLYCEMSTGIGLAECELAAGNPRAAKRAATAALAVARRLGLSADEASILANLGGYELALGNLAAAERDAKRAIEIGRLGHREYTIVMALEHVAAIAALRGRPEVAATLFGHNDAWYRLTGCTRAPAEESSYRIGMEALEDAMPRRDLDVFISRAAQTPLEDAMSLVLTE